MELIGLSGKIYLAEKGKVFVNATSMRAALKLDNLGLDVIKRGPGLTVFYLPQNQIVEAAEIIQVSKPAKKVAKILEAVGHE